MSPTEFSNYIKQRQMQHNHFHPHQQHQNAGAAGNLFGAIGSVSPNPNSRSISPNPMTLQMPQNDQSIINQQSPHSQQNPFVFQNGGGFGLNMYQSFGSPRNMMMENNGINGGNSYQYNATSNGNDPLLYMSGNGKCSSSFLDQVASQNAQNFCKIPNQQQTQQPNNALSINTNGSVTPNPTANNSSVTSNSTNSNNTNNSNAAPSASSGNQQDKLLDGMNSFYSNSNSSYQHLLVAN